MPRTTADFVTPRNNSQAEPLGDIMIPFHMDGRREQQFDLSLPPGADLDSRAVLAYMLHSIDADDLLFSIKVKGGKEIQRLSIDSDTLRAIHEIIPPGVLKKGDDNIVTFRLESGDGTLRIGDVVLWFQRFD